MSKYTEEDFANARFAEHESGRSVAARWTSREDAPDEHWTFERPSNNRFTKEATDQEMVIMGGWSPVPTKPTITESDFCKAWADSVDRDTRRQYRDFLSSLGITIAPDPEPTNAEKIEALIRGSAHLGLNDTDLAKYLDANGVKAGN